MNKFKKYLSVFALLLAVGLVWGRSSDIWSLRGRNPALRTIDVLRLTDSTTPDLELYNGDIYLKAAETQPSTTAGGYPGIKIALYNNSGSAWTANGLIVADTECAGCGENGGATTDLTTWVGIAESATASGSLGYVTVGGYALARTTGTVNRGDTLVSTTSAAGYLTGDATPTTGAAVGVALSSGTAAGGTTLILLR